MINKIITGKKFPFYYFKDGKIIYYWAQAYAGAYDHHYILNGAIWDKLNQYDRRDRSYGHKEYYSADIAMKDFLDAIGPP